MPHHDFLNSEYLQTDLGHQLPLSAYLLKPMQRLTKYQLLLKVGIRMRDDENYKFINDVCYKRNNDDVHPIADGYDLPVSYFLAGADHYRGDIYGESRVISIEMARESRLVFVATDHHATTPII